MKKDIAIIRESISRIVTMLTEKKIKVTQQGASAFVEYSPTGEIKRVNIPYLNDTASEDFISAVQGFLDHEVGHVLFSDQKVLLAIAKEGAGLKNLNNLIEDVYIERKISERFSGSGFNLNNVRKFFLEKCTRPAIDQALKDGNLELAKAYAIVAGFRAWGGQAIAKDFIADPMIAALLAPIRSAIPDVLIDRLQTVKNSWEVLELTREIKKHMDKLDEKEEPKEEKKPKGKPEKSDAKSKDEEAGEGDGEDASGEPEEGIEPSGKEKKSTEADDSGKKRDDSEKLEPVSGADGDEPTDSPSETKGEGGEEDSEEKEDLSDEDGGGSGDEDSKESSDEDAESSSEKTDEYEVEEMSVEDFLDMVKDFDGEIAEALAEEGRAALKGASYADYRIFTNEFDKIELAPSAKNLSSIEKVAESTKDKIGVMAKTLERAMAAKAKKAWIAGKRRGRVSPGALFKTAVGDDRVFRERFETNAEKAAVTLVVDCSGSMNGAKIRLAGETAFAIASVLERLRITHEVIGFTTYSSQKLQIAIREDKTAGQWSRNYPLYMPIFKDFKGKLDQSAKSRIAALYESPLWLHENIDGECIQIAARRLALQKSERKIMIVLSDGSPCCPSSKNLHGHLKSTVESLEKDKIEVIGIGIQDSSVKSYYPKNIVIHKAEDLPAIAMKQLSNLLLA